MLMNPNKGEAAVLGCHCPGDMAVRMRELLYRPWVGGLVYVCPLVQVCLIVPYNIRHPYERVLFGVVLWWAWVLSRVRPFQSFVLY